MRAVRDFDRVVVWSRTPGARPRSSTASRRSRPPRRRCATPTSSSRRRRRPSRSSQREWLKDGRARERRRLEHPDDARARHRRRWRDAALFVDRRESTVNEAGDFLFPQREGAIGPEHIRAEIGELLIGSAEGRRSDDELTVFKSLGLAVEDLAAAEHVLRRAEAEDAGTVVSL